MLIWGLCRGRQARFPPRLEEQRAVLRWQQGLDAPDCAGQRDSWVSRGRDGNWGAVGLRLGEKAVSKMGPLSSLGAEMALGAGSHPACCQEEC